MPKTVTSPLQTKLAAMLVELRRSAGLRQVDLAEALGVYQSWVTHMESGQRRIDVIELIELCGALQADPVDVVRKLVTAAPPVKPAPEKARRPATSKARRVKSG